MRLMVRFEDTGVPSTREDVSAWVVRTLTLRLARNRVSGRLSVPLSTAAKEVLAAGGVSQSWFEGFELRHPEVVFLNEASRPVSLQRAMAANTTNRDNLFKCREEALRSTGILDPETGIVDTRRVFNCDECPQQVDGRAKGNNRPKVYGM